MSNTLSNALLAQLFSQESNDPFLTLVKLSHDDFEDICLVNNTENVTSGGVEYTAFPMKIVFPKDDGESNREVNIEFDNVDRTLIDLIRSVTDYIDVSISLILASDPDTVQMSFDELKIQNITYNSKRVSAKLFMDNFLNTEMTSEKYTPTLYAGLF